MTRLHQRFPGQRARRSVLVVVLAGCALLVAYVLELHARFDWAQSTLEQIEPRYARLAGLLQAAPDIEAALERTSSQLSGFVYPSATTADRMGTDLQQRARQVAEAAGLSVINSRIAPGEDGELLESVRLVLTVQGTQLHLRQMLLTLPSEAPRIRLEALQVQAARGRGEIDRISAQLTLTVSRMKQ